MNTELGKKPAYGKGRARNARVADRRRIPPDSQLVRVPSDYCWKLWALLVDSLERRLDESLVREVRDIVRRRDSHSYMRLDSTYGLQSMAKGDVRRWGDPCAVRLITSGLRKHPSASTVDPSDRKARCLESVRTLDASLPNREILWRADAVLQRMKVEIEKILGPAPCVAEIAENARHGPGSSTTVGYDHKNSYFKYCSWPYPVAPRARDLLIDVIKMDDRWRGSLEDSFRHRYRIPMWRILNQDVFWSNIVQPESCWNKITSVPKDGTKDRPIAIEPLGNIFLQLGVAGVIRQRLLTSGLNLNTQDKNRSECLSSSLSQRSYTIDLSNASDTVSRDFCRAVLPPAWFKLLDDIRSPYGELPCGTFLVYRKMSSMGNATTFELESLLYWSLQRAIGRLFGDRGDLMIAFGDDLIGPSYLYKHTLAYLEICGFQPNSVKSFFTGPIRESCGVDALSGDDIRPVFLKDQPKDAMSIYNDRNRLNRWFARHYGSENPSSIDNFFSKFLIGDVLLGPESDTEMDTYWHVSDFPFIGYRSLARQPKRIPTEEFGFQKLMHSLRSASGEGHFLVTSGREGKIRIVGRAPTLSCYEWLGKRLDYAKQPFSL